MKKSLILLFTIFLCVLNGACLTNELYKSKSKKPPLNETITGFLVTADQKQLIFVGQHYHYIFPLPYDLKDILSWSGRGKLEARNLQFVISQGNIINGHYALAPIDQTMLTDDDRQFLLAHGFEKFDNQTLIYKSTLLQGRVYDSGHFQLPTVVAFKQPYHLMISYDYGSAGQTVGKILLTPLAVAADGVIIVVGAVVGVVAIPIILVDGVAHK